MLFGHLAHISFFFVFLAVSMASNAAPDEDEAGFVGVNEEGQLLLSPPLGGEVVIMNFTALKALALDVSGVKSELSDSKSQLSVANSQLSVALSNMSTTNSQLSAAFSEMSATKSELSGTQSMLLSVLVDLEASKYTWGDDLAVSLTSLTLLKKNYTVILGDLSVSQNPLLAGVFFPYLQTIRGSLLIFSNPSLVNVTLPLLSSVGGSIQIVSNAPAILVSLRSLNLTFLAQPYIIYAPNVTCVALSPSNCRAGLALLTGYLNASVLFPISSTWSPSVLPPLSVNRVSNPAVVYCSGPDAIFLAGGYSLASSLYLSSVSTLSLKSNSWTSIASMSSTRGWTSGVCLDDGFTILVFGGKVSTTLTSSCEKYNSSAGLWSAIPPMTMIRDAHEAVLYRSKAVILGGLNASLVNATSNAPVNHVEQFDPKTNAWTSLSPFYVPREVFGAAVVLDKIYIAGGCLVSGCCPCTLATAAVEVYNGSSWSILSSSLPSGARYSPAIGYQNKLVILGGLSQGVDVYDPLADAWSSMSPLPAVYAVYEVRAVAF